jgi:hypothetical protein
MPNFEALVNKLMFDEQFGRRMQSDPTGALTDLGIDPTEARLKAIREVDFDAIRRAAEVIGTAQKRPLN